MRRTAVCAAALLLAVSPAGAHLVSTGMGPVYDGMSHFLLSPPSLAPLLGLALWTGLRGPDHGRWALFTATGAWSCGSVLGLALAPPGVAASLSTAAMCLILGILAAADFEAPIVLTVVLAALIGLLDGAMSAAAAGTAAGLAAIVGSSAAVFALMALTASSIVPLRLLWLRIAVRVTGSWLAALGLLLMGWAIRARAHLPWAAFR
ncbi:MAG TPA: hypothetical protein VHZ53_09185 [Steroidobacteraceae bacterium]|jgi:hydrogenase/urease accessory protein HupE|nr:hypothetical protein [Steroidobacteraceae bacterium]